MAAKLAKAGWSLPKGISQKLGSRSKATKATAGRSPDDAELTAEEHPTSSPNSSSSRPITTADPASSDTAMELEQQRRQPESTDATSSSGQLLDQPDDIEGGVPRPSGKGFDAEYVSEVSLNRRSSNTLLSLTTGTGYGIYRTAILPSIKAAQQEVILVTCFWASSITRNDIRDALMELSKKAMASSTNISVHICFSSASLARNMLGKTPPEGESYPPEQWKKLGLPHMDQIQGLTLRVTRKFFRPFGIIHSKYVIIDRQLAIFPSCNVSWERWYEIALSIRGPIVDHLLAFHTEFWNNGAPLATLNPRARPDTPTPEDVTSNPHSSLPQPILFDDHNAYVTLLPSEHTPGKVPDHLQFKSWFSFWPGIEALPRAFPPTPLLVTTHHLIATAKSSILMFTPNLTELSVLDALTDALSRGVDIYIWTNRSLMTAEQLVTAGTTTPKFIQALTKRWNDARGRSKIRGALETVYFDARHGPQTVKEQDKEFKPVKLHAKVLIVDRKRMLLGSGNMDAASWQTSQELGVLVESKKIVQEFLTKWRYGKLGDRDESHAKSGPS